MSARFPDRESGLGGLIAGESRAVSSQHAAVALAGGSNSLHLYAERNLHLPSTEPDGRDLVLSCGIALHHCVVALAALGWQAKIHRLPNLDEPEHLAAIEVYPPSTQ